MMLIQDVEQDDERAAQTPSVVARLSAHAARIGQLIQVCGDPGRGVKPAADTTDNSARASLLHQEIRSELRRDYDAADQRALSPAEVVAQSGVYGAYAELSAGHILRSPRMLAEARKALRIVQAALRTLEAAAKTPADRTTVGAREASPARKPAVAGPRT